MIDLRQRVPIIHRAREYHLYSVSGKRYLDLWQNGGRALLGHRPGRLTTVLKNTISKGLIADLPSVFDGRLFRMLQQMFPDYRDFRITGGLTDGLGLASLYLGRSIAAGDLAEPLIEHSRNTSASLWRPLLPDQSTAEILFPIFPFGMAGSPVVLCFRRQLPQDFPVQQPVSALLLAGLLRCLHDLKRITMPEWYRPELLSRCPGWLQKGLYLVPDFNLSGYQQVFQAFLHDGVLLSPEAPCISILPAGEISKGELRKMIGLFRSYPGK